jgi:hypothetical protein
MHRLIAFLTMKYRQKSPLSKIRNLKQLEGLYSPLGILPGRKVSSLPERGIGLMRSWIQQCIMNHPRCQTDPHLLLPKRVIDVGISPEMIVRLYESNGDRANYASLSHRWGKSILLTTTKSTLLARKEAIEWSGLSKTFQDSITLTRWLGLRYLWIDSLCIVQDDSIDWQIESSNMAGIYEKSYVTFSANNSTGMLLGPPAMRKSHSVQLEVEDLEGKPHALIIRSPLDHEMFFASSLEGVGSEWERDYPLSKRAWCFQERLLATRILHFTDEEVVFECKTHCECECGSIVHRQYGTPLKKLYSGITQENFTPTGTATNRWEGWQMVVSPYAQKDITNSLDVLPALAGIASRVQSHELGQYVAGLWRNQLGRGLFWFADIISSRECPIKTAPTFSWASLAGTSKVKELQWPIWSDDKVKQLYRIIEIHCPVVGQNLYGTVSDAFLKLHGHVLAITLKNEQGRLPFNSVLRSKTSEHITIAFMDRDLITDITAERDYVCFLGFTIPRGGDNSPDAKESVLALILEPVGMDVYHRVGCLPFLDNDPAWLRDSEEKYITII